LKKCFLRKQQGVDPRSPDSERTAAEECQRRLHSLLNSVVKQDAGCLPLGEGFIGRLIGSSAFPVGALAGSGIRPLIGNSWIGKTSLNCRDFPG